MPPVNTYNNIVNGRLSSKISGISKNSHNLRQIITNFQQILTNLTARPAGGPVFFTTFVRFYLKADKTPDISPIFPSSSIRFSTNFPPPTTFFYELLSIPLLARNFGSNARLLPFPIPESYCRTSRIRERQVT